MKVTDVVCGMTLDMSRAAGTAMYEGASYYFCSDGCRRKFEAEPERYADGTPSEA